MAAGRRRAVEEEFRGRVRFERRAFVLVPRAGQRPAYDEYVVAHRVRAAQLAPELGFAIPKVGDPYPSSSWASQLLALRVGERQPDRLGALEDQLFAAMFRRLADISDPAVLRGCAEAAGVDAADVDLALADRDLKKRALREHAEAQAEGVQGIPALAVPGLQPLTGAVPLEVYRSALERGLELSRGEPDQGEGDAAAP